MITIHNFPRGARGVRVFWTCEEMGLPYARAVVTYPPSPEYLALNPLGSVPFLEDASGKRYPALRPLAAKLLRQGKSIIYKRQDANYYWYGEREVQRAECRVQGRCEESRDRRLSLGSGWYTTL